VLLPVQLPTESIGWSPGVSRETDPTNRRSVLVTLADRGRELIDEIIVDHVDLETKLLATLSSSEQEHLAKLLRKLLIGFDDEAVG